MTKIDRRRNYIIGLDTETLNGLEENGKADLSQSLVYDLGWVVTDKKGNIYQKRSFLIYETFVGMSDEMKSAYYAEKIPTYWEQVKTGERKLAGFYTIWKIFKQDMKQYNVKSCFAHNASFDLRALNNTIRYLTKSKYRYFFPYGTEIWDTLKMSRQVIATKKGYVNFCEREGYMTKHKKPRVRLTAEIIYRYLSGDYGFVESHTGLEDVLIETIILAYCFRQHKKMEKNVFRKK